MIRNATNNRAVNILNDDSFDAFIGGDGLRLVVFGSDVASVEALVNAQTRNRMSA